MRFPIIFLLFITNQFILFCQNAGTSYSELTRMADSLYHEKNFKNAAVIYSKAVNSYNKAIPRDIYNTACNWALAHEADSAFYYLERVAIVFKFPMYESLSSDEDLKSLYSDARWKPFLESTRVIKQKSDTLLNKDLVNQLDTIFDDDQKYRIELHDKESTYGRDSKEVKELWKLIVYKDSINLIKTEKILEKYGWPGPEIITSRGTTTLFLVIQHSDISTQLKYLPMMRFAVKEKKASASQLALLEDRVALRSGKKQIYGSQIGRDAETNQYYVSPLQDPDHVDKRRADVGLQPLEEYLSNWEIKWDVEQYKKDLPAIEEKEKKKRK